MKNTIIVDTGFWLALRNRKDAYHQQAKDCLHRYQKQRFICTWPVMTESCYLLAKQLGNNAAVDFINLYGERGFDVFDIVQQHAEQIAVLMERYRNLPMDLADASLVLLAEELGHGNILSTDKRDFETYRWKQHDPFNNFLMMQV